MCARLANLCVRTFVQLYKHVCVYLYNVYMHVCVRLAKLMDQAEKILQLQVNSSCSRRGIIAMQPRRVKNLIQTDFFVFFLPTYINVTIATIPHFGYASVETFIQTLIFVQFCYQHMISISLSPPNWGSASVQEFYRKFFANKSISVSSSSYVSTP